MFPHQTDMKALSSLVVLHRKPSSVCPLVHMKIYLGQWLLNFFDHDS